MGFPPNASASGSIDEMCLAARQGVGLLHGIVPAGDIVRSICETAIGVIQGRLAG